MNYKQRQLARQLIAYSLLSVIITFIMIGALLGMNAVYLSGMETEMPQTKELEMSSNKVKPVKSGYIDLVNISESVTTWEGGKNENIASQSNIMSHGRTSLAASVPTVILTDIERYELAKIVMCETEAESIHTKAMVAYVVLNRVNSPKFPNNIHDVIFQKYKGTWQFSPLGDGSWRRKEPNAECYQVVDMIAGGQIEDTSQGATYFEAVRNGRSWHSRNLEFLFQSDRTRFYK